MKVIGITGPTGAGKTTALRALQELGAVVLDADGVYHEMLLEDGQIQAALLAAFGPGIRGEDGHITSRNIAALAYPDRLQELTDLTQPLILAEIARRIDRARASGTCPAVAIDAISLVESGAARLCDHVVAVLAPEAVRLRRIMARDNIDEAYARRRMAAQKGEGFFRSHADFVLENTDTDAPEDFHARCVELFAGLIGAE